MELIKTIKCISCLVNCGKVLCFAKKMLSVIAIMIAVCSAMKIFVIKDMTMKDITKKMKKMM